jgi:hypothetical protein
MDLINLEPTYIFLQKRASVNVLGCSTENLSMIIAYLNKSK